MKKRFTAFILALALCIGLTVPAHAAGQKTKTVTTNNITLNNALFMSEYQSIADRWNAEGHKDWVKPEHEVNYSLGIITFLFDEGPATKDFNCYFLPSNGTFTAHHKADGLKLYVQGWKLEEGTAISGGKNLKNWKATPAGSMWYTADKAGDYDMTLSEFKADIQEYNGSDKFDLVECWVEGSASVYIRLTGNPVLPFTDVPTNGWYADSVAWAVQEGITKGTSDTTFSPDRICTHAQILTFLWRAAGEPAYTGKAPHSVPSYYADGVAWACGQNWLKIPDSQADVYGEGGSCTRAQAVWYIWSAMGQPKPTKTANFSDMPDNLSMIQAISWAVEKGITKGDGSDSIFNPDKICSRAHIMTFLYRAYN